MQEDRKWGNKHNRLECYGTENFKSIPRSDRKRKHVEGNGIGIKSDLNNLKPHISKLNRGVTG